MKQTLSGRSFLFPVNSVDRNDQLLVAWVQRYHTLKPGKGPFDLWWCRLLSLVLPSILRRVVYSNFHDRFADLAELAQVAKGTVELMTLMTLKAKTRRLTHLPSQLIFFNPALLALERSCVTQL